MAKPLHNEAGLHMMQTARGMGAPRSSVQQAQRPSWSRPTGCVSLCVCVCVAELLPPKPRPKTTAAVAKKLLSHALGMPQLRDRQGERVLAQARKDAKQDRQARREAAAAAWGDDD